MTGEEDESRFYLPGIGYVGKPDFVPAVIPAQRTLPEALDAAEDGEQFGQVLQGLFRSLEKVIDAEREEDE